LQLRALAFQQNVVRKDPFWNINENFVIWGCGRDGKDFYKSLDPDLQQRVYCFVDVDIKKLNAGYYVDSSSNRASNQQKGKNRETPVTARKIPIVHFSFLIQDQIERKIVQECWKVECESINDSFLGRIDKSKSGNNRSSTNSSSLLQAKKKHKINSSGSRTVAKLYDRGLDQKLLYRLPVVVCVAMYRTSGVLEKNVSKIGRTEGEDLWHFS